MLLCPRDKMFCKEKSTLNKKILKNILFLNSYRLRFCKHAFALNFDILPCSISLKIGFSAMVGVVLKSLVEEMREFSRQRFFGI